MAASGCLNQFVESPFVYRVTGSHYLAKGGCPGLTIQRQIFLDQFFDIPFGSHPQSLRLGRQLRERFLAESFQLQGRGC
jgi:hypothetical protein